MKIGLIRKNYSPYGGAEKYIARLIDSLIKNGHEVHVFSNSWKANENIPRLYFHHVPMIKGASFLKVLSFALNAKKILKKNNLDFIYSFERTLCQDIYRAGDGCHKEWLIHKKKKESLFEKICTHLNPLHIVMLAIEKRIFKNPHLQLIIANSNRGKNEIIKHYQVPDKKIEVVYNGVDLEEFSPSNRQKYRKKIRDEIKIRGNEALILFVGSGFKRKGLSSLIYAFDLLLRQTGKNSARLLVAGRGSKGRYERICKQLHIQNQVLFLGPYKDIKQLYAAADIFVLPSLYEPFSNACCEAMASGLPVITSQINGVSELINHGKNGFVIKDPTSSQEIMKSLLALQSEEKRNQIGKNAHATSEKFQSEAQNVLMIEILNHMIEKNTNPCHNE